MANPFRRRSLTASVSVVQQHDGKIKPKSKDFEWQKDAWAFYHDLGEVRFAARYVGNALSRVRFFVGTRDNPGDPIVPIPDEPDDETDKAEHEQDLVARQVLDRVRGRDGTFASLVRTHGIQQFVAGEAFLVGEDGLEGERWEFLSTSEMRRKESKLNGVKQVTNSKVDPNGEEVEIDDNSLVLRFWQRDPEFRERADSPMRPVLDVLDALRTAQAMQTAGDRSRLATAGLYLIPAEADLPKVADGDPTKKRLQLIDDLLENMVAAMSDPGSAAAVVPILVETKAEFIKEFRHETFSREVDQSIVARIDHLIRRLAQGLDLPVEKLLGVGNMNHWGAWQVSEETITAHISPMAAAFCEDMTVGFLRPTLTSIEVDFDVDRYAIGFDTSDLLVKPNPADNALELYDRILLAGVETVGALGFRADQMPDEEEIAARMEQEKAMAPAPPEQLPPPEDADGAPEEQPTADDEPDEDVPEKETTSNAAWLLCGRMAGACDLAVEAVLTAAGAALRERASRVPLVADRIVNESDIAVATVLGADGIEGLGQSIDLLLTDAWGPITRTLQGRLAEWSGSYEVAVRIIGGLDVLARARMFDPNIDVAGAAQVLCEAALDLVAV